MKFFHVKKDNVSYVYPTVKTVVCMALISIIIYINHIVLIDNKVFYNMFNFLCLLIVMFCAYCIFISIDELLLALKNRKEGKNNTGDGASH